MLCSELSVVNREGDGLAATVLRCNRWSCDYCQPFKQRELKRLARAGQPNTFLTLTSRASESLTPDDDARGLVRAWRLIVKRAKRKYHLKSLPYITVIEATKAGQPHLHILLRVNWLHQKWISEQMQQITGAPIVYIERIHNPGKIAAYVAKYIAKAPHRFDGCKRYWRSLDYIVDRQSWEELHHKVKGAWIVERISLAAFERKLLLDGWAVSWLRPDYLIAEPGSG